MTESNLRNDFNPDKSDGSQKIYLSEKSLILRVSQASRCLVKTREHCGMPPEFLVHHLESGAPHHSHRSKINLQPYETVFPIME